METKITEKELEKIFKELEEGLFCPYCFSELVKHDEETFLYCPYGHCWSDTKFDLNGNKIKNNKINKINENE